MQRGMAWRGSSAATGSSWEQGRRSGGRQHASGGEKERVKGDMERCVCGWMCWGAKRESC